MWGWRKTLGKHTLEAMTEQAVHDYRESMREAARELAKTYEVLDILHDKVTITTIVHGDAKGADSLAGKWAALWQIPVERYPANWTLHGRAAGPIRNQQMLVEAKPDIVVAFPGGVGTDDMKFRAEDAGVELLVVNL